MRVALLSPGRISSRPDLARLVGGGAAVATALQLLSRVRADGADPDPPRRMRHDRVIEAHEVSDPALVPAHIWCGTLQHADAPTVSGMRLESATARVTPHGLVLLRLMVDLDDAELLREAEDALCPWVDRRIETLAREIGRVVRREGLAHTGGTSRGDLREDAFLWWHRLLIGAVPPAVLARYEIDRYPAVVLRPGVHLRVADGYSHLGCHDLHEAARILDGLAAATQVWVSADHLQRRLTDHAARLRTACTTAERAAQQSQAADLYEEATLETAVLLQALRYTVGGPRHTYDVAARSWNIDTQLDRLVESAEALRQAIERRHQEARDAQSARLARGVSALTFVGALGVVLPMFETAVGSKLPPQFQRARLTVSAAVALTAIVVLVALLAPARWSPRRLIAVVRGGPTSPARTGTSRRS